MISLIEDIKDFIFSVSRMANKKPCFIAGCIYGAGITTLSGRTIKYQTIDHFSIPPNFHKYGGPEIAAFC
jgi:hypothetical protein